MIMKKNEKPSFLRGRGAAVGIVICFVAVIAMVGTYTFNNYQKQIDEQVAKAEEQAEKLTEDRSEEAATDDIVLPEADNGMEENTETEVREQSGLSGEETTEEDAGTAEDTGASGTASEPEVWFSEESTLAWPASGAVIIGYSMDQTVFFSPLEQYKYNPALVIQSDVNTKVLAAADGQVLSVETTPETGETVAVDIGGGYQLVYGQLKEIQFAVGDRVSRGDLLGFVSEPTKYYSVEGSNLYFQMLKDGEPVNPMDYLQ